MDDKKQAKNGSKLFQTFKQQTKKYKEKVENQPPPRLNDNGLSNSGSARGGGKRQSCCRATRKRKSCIRKDGKHFRLPRKFSKKQCKRPKGFSMRSSCAPYKFCKTPRKNKRKQKHKP